MTDARLQALIDKAFELTPEKAGDVREAVEAVEAVEAALDLLDAGCNNPAQSGRPQEKGSRTSSDWNFRKSRSLE
jgi:hypothetical protein